MATHRPHRWTPSHRLTLSTLVVGLALAASTAAAQGTQTGVVVGTVTDRMSAQPLDASQVQIVGSRIGGVTDGRGHFIIRGVPAGPLTVRAQRLGYRPATQSVTVPAGDSVRVSLSLDVSAVQLSEVVTTGTGGAVEKRKLGVPIGVVDMSKVEEVKPLTDIGAALEGSVAGVRSVGVGGGVGAAKDLRIRGTSSFTLGQRPVVYIDGVRVDTRATDWTAGLGNQACCNFNGGAGEDRLSDLNPDDIDHIEVLKGAAAATLYGSEASNGVIQIFTKKGKMESAPQWSFGVTTGFDRQRANYPTKLYPNFVGKDGTRALDMNKTLIGNGPFQDYQVSVQGGANRATYFVSGGFSDEQGSIQPNDQKKGSLRVNVGWTPSDKLTFEARSFFDRNFINSLQSGNNWTALTGNASNGDPRNATKLRPYGEAWVSVADIQRMTSTNDAGRYTGGLTMSYQALPNFLNRLTVGLDQTSEQKQRFFPFDGNYGSAYVNNGEKDDGFRNYSVYTMDYLGQLNFTLPFGVGSDLSFGGQGYYETEQLNIAIGKQFAGPGVTTVSSASQTFGGEQYTHAVNVGGLVQDRFSFGDHLFTTVGLRIDGNSAFGKNYGFQKYPKVDVAYNLTGYSWMPTAVSSLKLRGAIGTAGKAPGPFDQYLTFQPEAVFQNTPALTPLNPGNVNLAPEKTTETDIGFDAGFFADRLGIEASVFKSSTNNAIIGVSRPPSEGFTRAQQQNIGGIDNHGWEFGVNWLALSVPNLEWRNEVRLDGTTNKVTSLGGATGVRDGAGNLIKVGHPIGGIWTRAPKSFDPGTKRWTPTDTAVYFGAALPSLNLSYSPSLRWRRFQFYTLVTMERGAWFLNSDRPYRWRQHTGDEYLSLLGAGGVTTPAADSAVAYWRLFDDPEQRNNVRLREVSLGYEVPDPWTNRMGLGHTTMTLSAANVMWWDHCHCVDPNMNWAGASSFGTNNGFLSDPSPRQFRLAIRSRF